MRRIVYAASFVADADEIAAYIESRFGVARTDTFIIELNDFCELVATQPRLGKKDHGYETTLYGVVHDVNWIFFQYDDLEVRFVHIVDGRRHKSAIKF